VPLYEYECSTCRFRFERIQRFSDPPVSLCPECGGAVSQLLSPPAIQFKGSGWYVTDYASRNSGPKPGNGKADKTSGGESKPAAKTETKSESAPAASEKK
jgi:putative FmdB family regulatory protein